MSTCNLNHTPARSDTRSVAINVAPEEVFRFLADPHNLPQWAVGFCRSIRHVEKDRWLVTTPSGEIPIRFERNADARSVDFYFTPAPGFDAAAYSRVVPNGDGSEYIFTQFQVEGMPVPVFEAQVQALAEELQVLRALLHARRTCQPALTLENH